MYSYLEGKLVEITPTYVTLDINGIGYNINISLNTYSQINELKECKLLCHFVVREDAQVLYGFYAETERMLFRHLISVSGIGANTARLILSSMTSEDLYSIIINGDAVALQKIKGIGGKSAQRIIIDLQDKLGKQELLSDLSAENIPVLHNTKKEEALSGLVILGFSKNVAGKAIDKVLADKGTDISVEQLIKSSLKLL